MRNAGRFCALCIGAAVTLGVGGSCLAALAPGDILLADGGIQLGTGQRDYGAIFKIDPVTGAKTVISGGNDFSVYGVTLDHAGQIIATHSSNFEGPDRLVRVDPDTGARTVISSGGFFDAPDGVVVEASGAILVADYRATTVNGRGAIIRVDPLTGAQTIVSSGGAFNAPGRLRLDGAGNIWVVDAQADTVFRVDPVTGVQTPFATGGLLTTPIDLAFDANGDLLIADCDAGTGVHEGKGSVIKIDRLTGAQSFVSEGGTFLEPYSIVVEPDGNLLVGDWDYTDYMKSSLIRVNPVTGAQTELISTGLSTPFGLHVVVPEPAGAALAACALAVLCRRRRTV